MVEILLCVTIGLLFALGYKVHEELSGILRWIIPIGMYTVACFLIQNYHRWV